MRIKKVKTDPLIAISVKRLTGKNGTGVGPNAARSSRDGLRIPSKDKYPAAETFQPNLQKLLMR